MAGTHEITQSQLSCSGMSTSTINDTTRLGPMMAVDVRFCLIGDQLSKHTQLHQALQKMKMPYVFSDTGQEYLSTKHEPVETVFVLPEFEGETFQLLTKNDLRVLGPTAIIQSAATEEHLPCVTRPLFCRHMDKLVICFTGFLDKAELKRLVVAVHNMGGSIRRDYGPRITHLVANSTNSEKYRVAVSLGTPIMTSEWIQATWERRNQEDCTATSEEMLKYKMPPFFGCTIGFVGFSEEEQRHMEEITQTQGGSVVSVADDSCTHIVVDENTVPEQLLDYSKNIKLVKQEWFWASIQMDARAEEGLYTFRIVSTPASIQGTPTMIFSGSKSSRKRRLKQSIAALSSETDSLESPLPPQKRRSSFAESASCMSISASSILDASQTPECSSARAVDPCTPMETETPKKAPPAQPLSKRHMTLMELLQTEINYVKILDTIITVFKEPLEKEQTGGALLPQEDIKTIFNRIPDIYAVHCRLKDDIQALLDDYSDDKSLGQIIVKHSTDMSKAYPQFVNFFELAKQTVVQCDKQKPRFHAFLKICQSRPECGRQSLTELLIRPVQRLPSMILLLSDLWKRTPETHSDYTHLKQGLDALKKVTEQINEDKRKTEGHTQMFDIMNDIEGVPPDLLSAHRQFVTKIDVSEIGKGDTFSEKGICITMFLFSDTLEICKKRARHANSKTSQKMFKHIELLSLSYIRRVLDINETEECHNAFALLCKPPVDVLERTDRLYMFAVASEESSKTEWLKTLCQHMANTTCKTDAENFLLKISPEDLELSKSDFDVSRKNKAVRAAKRATKKVTRTFSFNKTPRRSIQKAVSSVSSTFSPMVTGENMTPQQFEKMGSRLAGTMTLKALSPLARRTPLTPRLLQKSLTLGPSTSHKL
ncbi:protein ECT2-like [Diadema antillarum]|uniref:protein ECT2-like n=1 Tax=Diadema antillarum TaxID=105358 RepID=UPI003A835646